MTEGSDDSPLESVRPRSSIVLLALAFLATVVAGPLVYASTVVRDEGRFVDLAGHLFDEPEVRAALADEIVEIAFTAISADELVADVLPTEARQLATPVTRLATDQLTRVAFTTLDTDVAVRARETALRELHQQIVDSDDATVTIDLRAVIVRVAREFGGPSVGSAVAAVASTQDIGRFDVVHEGSGTGALMWLLRQLPDVAALALATTLVLFALSIVVARDRRRCLMRAGLCVTAASLTSTVALAATLSIVVNFGDDGALGDLGPAVSGALSADFAARQRGVMLTGLAIASIALTLGPSRSARALRTLPRHAWRRDGRSVASSFVTVLGDNPACARLLIWGIGSVALLSWPTPTVRVLVSIPVATLVAQFVIWLATSRHPRAIHWRENSVVQFPPADADTIKGLTTPTGTTLAFVAAATLLLWPAWSRSLLISFGVVVGVVLAAAEIPGAVRHARRSPSTDAAIASTTEPFRPTGRFVGVAAAVAVALSAGAVVSASSGAGNGRSAADGCNGHIELCDRRIDEVTFAGSHNSMSSRELGWDLAMQQGDIIEQLDFGVRALLIDTHYWDRRGIVEGGDDPAAQFVIEAALADDRPQPGLWLCHGFCGLGASRLESVLAEISTWLDENPREVVLMIIQDEISTADTMEAFEQSGLIRHVHQHVPSTPWPTLGALIESDERLLVWAENEGEPDSWYQNGYDTTFAETPYTFAVRSDFSCEPNRGAEDNPLFLINHWVTSGIPILASGRAVNSSRTLTERVEQCRSERGRDPTILAVDFAQVGDLIAVVDDLNGVER